MGEKWPVIWTESCGFYAYILGSFTCRKYAIWDKQLYFPSEGRRAVDFFALKNPMALAGFEPMNLGTKGQHATSRPPKPLKTNGKLYIICNLKTANHTAKVLNFCNNLKHRYSIKSAEQSTEIVICTELSPTYHITQECTDESSREYKN